MLTQNLPEGSISLSHRMVAWAGLRHVRNVDTTGEVWSDYFRTWD